MQVPNPQNRSPQGPQNPSPKPNTPLLCPSHLCDAAPSTIQRLFNDAISNPLGSALLGEKPLIPSAQEAGKALGEDLQMGHQDVGSHGLQPWDVEELLDGLGAELLSKVGQIQKFLDAVPVRRGEWGRKLGAMPRRKDCIGTNHSINM